MSLFAYLAIGAALASGCLLIWRHGAGFRSPLRWLGAGLVAAALVWGLAYARQTKQLAGAGRELSHARKELMAAEDRLDTFRERLHLLLQRLPEHLAPPPAGPEPPAPPAVTDAESEPGTGAERVAELEQLLDTVQAERDAIRRQAETLDSDVRSMTELLRSQARALSRAREEAEELVGKNEDLQRQLETPRQTSQLSRTEEALRRQVKEADLRAVQLQDEMDRLSAAQRDLREETDIAQRELALAREREAAAQRGTEELSALQAENESLRSRLEQKEQRLSATEKAARDLLRALEGMNLEPGGDEP